MALNWNDLFMQGSLVDVDVSVWGARLQLKASDLGIDTNEVRKALSLGCHRLAPPETFEKLNEIVRAVKRDVEAATLHFAMIRGARFCPEKKLEGLHVKLRAHRERFDEEVNAIVADYDKTKAEMLPTIENALRDAAKTPEDAAKAFQRVQAEYPSVDVVRTKFGIRWTVFAIAGPANPQMAALGEEAKNVSDVITGMVQDLYVDVKKQLTNVLTLVAKGGPLQERTLNNVTEVLDRVSDLNFVGDTVLSTQVAALRRFIAGVDRKAVDVGFVQGLQQVSEELTANLTQATKAAEAKLTGLGRRKLAS